MEEEIQDKTTSLVAISMNKDSDSADEELPAAASHVIIMVFLYIACLACSLLYSGRYDFDCTEDLPWIGSQNATNIVMKRLKNIEMEYEAALLSGNWTCLQSEPNFTIEVMETESRQRPVYLRTTAVYPMKPEQLYKRFKLDNFDTTMKTVNPLYESSKLLFSPATKFFFPANGINIFKIVRFINSCPVPHFVAL